MSSVIRQIEDLLAPGEPKPGAEWEIRSVQSLQCISYVAWNTRTREALVVDPKIEDLASYREIAGKLSGYLWLGVFDTHTHADHISCASMLAKELGAPLVMHVGSPSRRVDLRISQDTHLPARAAPVRAFTTPGHTPDSLTFIWGPFLFGGDTLLNGDTGRDDLPGGDPEAHFTSVQKMKAIATPELLLLPGHGAKGTNATSWKTQVATNPSLTQTHDVFVAEAAAFSAPAPALLKESLRENFK